MVIVNAVLTTFQLISETGARAFIIRDEDGDQPVVINTVRSILIIRGLIIGALVAGFAPQIAGLFGKPELATAIRWMALVPAMEGCMNLRVHLTTRERRQRFNEVFELSVFAVATVVTFVLAFWLRSYWAFIYAGIVTAAIKVIGAEIFYKRIPFELIFNKKVLHRMWTFSSYIFLATLLSLVVNQTDKVIVGSRLPLEVAGVYGMAMTLTVIFTQLANNFSKRVFFADAAASIREKGRVPEAYYGNMQTMRYLLLFVFGGGLTFGETFFDVFFDDRYLMAGVIFSVSVIRPIIKVYADPAQAFIVATGFTKAALIASILRFIHILALAPLLFAEFGLMGLVAAVATMDLWAAFFLNYRLMREGVWSLKAEIQAVLAIAAGAATGFVGSISVRYLLGLFGL